LWPTNIAIKILSIGDCLKAFNKILVESYHFNYVPILFWSLKKLIYNMGIAHCQIKGS